MRVKQEFAEAQRRFGLLGFYDKFEHIVILILTALITVFIVFAIWNLTLKIFLSIASSTFDPTDYAVFQAVFGMIFTVIIALEFKRSLLVAAERQHSVGDESDSHVEELIALIGDYRVARAAYEGKALTRLDRHVAAEDSTAGGPAECHRPNRRGF